VQGSEEAGALQQRIAAWKNWQTEGSYSSASSSMSLRPAVGSGALLDRVPFTRLPQTAVCREPSRARNGALACRSAVTGIDSDPASFDAVRHQSLDQEWLRLGLSIAPEGGSRLDEEWLRLGLSFPSYAASSSATDLDAVWLQLGLTVTDSEPIVITPEGAMTVSEAVAASESRALAPGSASHCRRGGP